VVKTQDVYNSRPREDGIIYKTKTTTTEISTMTKVGYTLDVRTSVQENKSKS